MVEEPLRDPVRRVARVAHAPEWGGARVPAVREKVHGVPFGLLGDVVPVEGRRASAVGLEVLGAVGDPGVDAVGFTLWGEKALACGEALGG